MFFSFGQKCAEGATEALASCQALFRCQITLDLQCHPSLLAEKISFEIAPKLRSHRDRVGSKVHGLVNKHDSISTPGSASD
ncbi:hypothetical protein J6590_063800 [Homalodisca vitripennis]|nr:hypothetical protein J6590_063800 [Homalodisca vitripennis]